MKPLLIVNEHARAAAIRLVGETYQVISYHDVTETILADRNVLYWPDAGEAGIKRRTIKYAQCAAQLKRISTMGQPKGWNAVKAIEDGWTYRNLVDWAKPRTEVIPYIPEAAEETVPTGSQYALLERLGLALSKDGKPICNAANVVRFLKGDPVYSGHLWFDDFSGRMYADVEGIVQEWSDHKTSALMIYLQDALGMHKLSKSMVSEAVEFIAQGNHRHQVRDWLSTLAWDGTERVSSFFSTYCGATSSAAMNAFGAVFWISMIKRVMRPGCQADYMVVLKGAQGTGKTKTFQTIGGTWYADVGITADSIEFERQIQGKLLVEISELHAFSKSDQSRIKQIITKRDDRYTEKYKEHSRDHPRQCILVGTTNETEWIKDQTGGRRFLPITCSKIELEALQRDREQLFAEALHRFKNGDEGYLMPEVETNELQEVYREKDPWEALLQDKLGMLEQVTLIEAMGLLGVPMERMDWRAQRRASYCLRQLGFDNTPVYRDGATKRVWHRVTNGNE